MSDKRRIVNQLPVVNQTETLKKFFGSTVDHLFQPGRAKTISGYIGKKPDYYDPLRDFYIQEQTSERQAHQLEATMVNYNADGSINTSMFYNDIINYIRSYGGNVSDHSKLFDTEFYSWAPPVDLDKLSNPMQYYWYPDRREMPTVDVRSTITEYIGDGIETTFEMPAAISGIDSSREEITVFIDYVQNTDFTVIGDDIILNSPLPLDSNLVIMRYGDLVKLISGLDNFDVSSLTNDPVTFLTNGMQLQLIDASNYFSLFDIAPFEMAGNPPSVDVPWDFASQYVYIVEGVGDSIVLSQVSPDYETEVRYVTIARGSENKNQWSVNNFWAHTDAIAWAGAPLEKYRAKRPIIEYLNDIRLFNYGWNRIDEIDGACDGTVIIETPFDVLPFDTIVQTITNPAGGTWDNSGPIKLTPDIIKNDDTFATYGFVITDIVLDDGIIAQDGMRIILRNSDFGTDDDHIFKINSTTVSINGILKTVKYLTTEPDVISLGDVTKVTGTESEYWFNGTEWLTALPYANNQSPLFNLYDSNGILLSDDLNYPESTFSGSSLFYYSINGSSNDNVLNIAVSKDSNGQIIFENTIVTNRYEYENGDIIGFYYFLQENNGEPLFNNNWYLSPITTTQTIENNEYTIPLNLQANPDNDEVTFITRSEWSEHFAQIIESQIGFEGAAFSKNNWRDVKRDLSLGKTILQHRAPLLKTMLLASNESFNIINSIKFVENEYNRFKAKFIQRIIDFRSNGILLDTDSVTLWVDTILNSLKANKNTTFPFAFSEIGGNRDYIPPTPAGIGILKATEPTIITDNSYGTPIDFIVGHDGSRMPIFGDIRDTILLELETRIYNNILAKFKTEDELLFNINRFVSSKYYTPTNGYTKEDVDAIMVTQGELWAQQNRFDYRTNDTFVEGDPFTWNYSSTEDKDGEKIPGHWRGIYVWYFDTDRPNTHPWEMLGFYNKPGWWDTQYGTDYSRLNTAMWSDLENGFIAQGARQGIDERYVRNGLSRVIPVDDSGNLLDPIAAGIVARAPTYQQASKNWKIGDNAPVESLWRMSSSYRYSLAILSYLLKPARFIEICWDTENHVLIHDSQWIDQKTYDRPSLSEQYIHGETLDSERLIVIGVQQFISDYLVSKGLSSQLLGESIRNTQVRIAHRMAGFTSDENLKAVTDNFGLIPIEDIAINLHQSPSTREEYYSGIVVEWIGHGWRVIGYNAANPVFNIIPNNINGPKTVISLSNQPEAVVTDWKPNTYYMINNTVAYNGSGYRCIKSHTSSSTFESEYWQPEQGLVSPPAPRVLKYKNGINDIQTVPYGTVFTTHQDIADFIFGYERWLKSRGWIFDNIDYDTQTTLDWTLSTKEFLAWSQVDWAVGSFIALSPSASEVKFRADHGSILNVEKTVNGVYGLVNKSGISINSRDTVVTRLDGEISIKSVNNNIFGAKVRVSEVEHVIVFSNTTIFNDIIYQPLYNVRQSRIRLIAQRTENWNGRLDAPGYIVSGSELIPNFDRTTENIRTMFDIEMSDESDLRSHARHNVGYQQRSYLDNILLSDTEQFEFFQGSIQQKGAPGVFEKLLRSQYVGQARDLRFLEEWAINIGQYGALGVKKRIEFRLRQSDQRRDPQYIELINENGIDDQFDDVITLQKDDTRWIVKPEYDTVFPVRETYVSGKYDLPDAGFVRFNEVDRTFFNYDDIENISVDNLPGYNEKIWVFNRNTKWDILRGYYPSDNDVLNPVERMVNASNNSDVIGTRIYFESPHSLNQKDLNAYIVFGSETFTSPELNGCHKIKRMDQFGYWVEIDEVITNSITYSEQNVDVPEVIVLRSMRFDYIDSLDYESRPFNDGDLIYINDRELLERRWDAIDVGFDDFEYDTELFKTKGQWVVLEKNGSDWNIIREQPKKIDSAKIEHTLVYDLNTKITDEHLYAQPLVVDHMNIIDPIAGFVPGVAKKEISYMLEYDPARYTNGQSFIDISVSWGKEQEGMLWWDLSKVRFVNSETDIISDDPTRRQAELAYRVKYWANIAPGSSIDIYEWTRSSESPLNWGDDGDVYGGDTPVWVEKQEYDNNYGSLRTFYYFWVKNRTKKPNKENRTLSSYAISNLILNPASSDIAWFAPVTENSMLVGGIRNDLNDSGTVLQVNYRINHHEGNIHDQWIIVRPDEDREQIPEWLWKKLRDSMVGFDDDLNTVPDHTLHYTNSVGIKNKPRQNVFGITDEEIFSARKSFIENLNNILIVSNISAERTDAISDLFFEDEPLDYLSWTAEETITYRPIPKNTEWDYQVYSIEERDRLLLTTEFSDAYSDNEVLRVLVNNKAGSIQSWSVWEFNPANIVSFPITPEDKLENASEFFELAAGYNHVVSDFSSRNTLSVSVNDRVLVTGNATTDGFWTIWKYDPGNVNADEQGFVLTSWQTTRTIDFWNYVDWYAEGYNSENPPAITYNTIIDRNVAENPEPSNTIVKINDDGTGSWIWTEYIDGNWVTVAQENGTIQLSDDFYNISKTKVGVNNLVYSDIKKRDGSFELRYMIDVIINALLENNEVNDIFFGLVHFVHSTQDQVDWIFKTSFLSVGGFNEPLIQTAILQPDNTENLLSYIEEVKPYHVKIRDFVRSLTPNMDEAYVRVFDFDKPVYYDPVLESYRRLDPNNPLDIEILSNDEPWIHWYSSVIAEDDLVRQLKVNISFDRVSGNDTGSDVLDGGELSNENDDIIDGNNGSSTDVYYNPEINGRTSFDIVDPYAENHPQELVVGELDDALTMVINGYGPEGAPEHLTLYTDVSTYIGATAVLNYIGLPQSSDGILVYRDGIKINDGSDYTVDFVSKTIIVNLDYGVSDRAEYITIHTVGTAGLRPIFEEHEYVYTSGPADFVLEKDPENRRIVISVNGAYETFTVNGNVVTLDNIPNANDIVLITVYEYAGDYDLDEYDNTISGWDNQFLPLETETKINIETLSYDISQTWTLINPSDQFGPEHISTIVEVNGARLFPPHTHYVHFNAMNNFKILDISPNVNNIKLWIDNEYYSGTIDDGPWADIGDAVTNGSGNGFALVDNTLVSLDPDFDNDVVIIITEDHDYDVINGELEIYTTLSASDEIKVTTFTKSDLMNIKTHTFYGNSEGEYEIQLPNDLQRVWSSVNGLRIVGDVDFGSRSYSSETYDYNPWDSFAWDVEQIHSSMIFDHGHDEMDRLIVTVFEGEYTTKPYEIINVTDTPAGNRMLPDMVESGYDLVPFDTFAWDQATAITAVSPFGDNRPLFKMDTTWTRKYIKDSDKLSLVSDSEDNMTLLLNDLQVVRGIIPVDDLTLSNNHGKILINGEKIDYYDFEKINELITIGELRRGQKGTRHGYENRSFNSYIGDGNTATFVLNNALLSDGIDVGIREIPINQNNEVIGIEQIVNKKILKDFNAIQNGSDVEVTFINTPEIGTIVYLSQTIDYTQKEHSKIYNML